MRENARSSEMLSPSAVQKKLKKFDKSFKPYKQKLIQYYGDDLASKITEQTRNEYERLLPETPQFDGSVNVFNWAIGVNVLIVAFYRSMKTYGNTVEDVIRILIQVSEDSHGSIPTMVRWFARKFVFSRIFLRIVRRSAEKVRNHPEGWKIDYKKGDGKTSDWYFECHECGVIKYYEKHGAAELSPYCNYIDYIQSHVLGMGMHNPKNIGQGDEKCCEYMKEGRETSLPDNLAQVFGTNAIG
ncbi:MAG: L-2-amino-thiazoline-4-carboxylic acid hydrolase [Chloroflexi bacterium]|nr:L-2-amino-thiazoline-4-carboxylic acid hydrolase [Chloroflexota bacterium]